MKINIMGLKAANIRKKVQPQQQQIKNNLLFKN
jgi:hypothetical protein